ncbi:NAD(P)-dependent oxidoreductase [Primorskyibacter flagellatus]|uniref:D-3-phosphoglycerate dehydrogenase n=1 Tax=Primorskyibacter flagellatus TaxID=1387277 RepID=A0A1W2E3B6_9RHOB|nr:NAD(P)-dependent oxidoreductase [Primorskyibacter flagellatus]SMD03947.1 D-3-phosphoglycerate dehydrogenase [Primorskyibacter flagellatus]
MARVLVLDPIHPDGMALLQARDDIEIVHLETPTEQAIAAQMPQADYLLLRGRTVAEAHYCDAPRLRMVSRHGVGCDNLNSDQLRSLGIGVAITADANYVAVAEHAMMLTLAACKNLGQAQHVVRNGDWTVPENRGARELCDAETMVFGFGRIGRAYAQRAAAFGARIRIFDPYLPEDAALPDGYRRATDILEVADADVISLHMPLSTETANLFDATLLAQLKPGAIVVNTGRGGVVDEAAVVAALETGTPSIYATDVFAKEPPARDDPLLKHPGVIVTPHSAAMTTESVRRMAMRSAQNILDHLDGTLSPEMVVLPVGRGVDG